MALDLDPIYSFVFSNIRDKEYNNRVKFLYKLLYVNYWIDIYDIVVFINKNKTYPDFEKLYKHYNETGLLPVLSRLVVGFIRYTKLFVNSNRNKMFVVSEELLCNWSVIPSKRKGIHLIQ